MITKHCFSCISCILICSLSKFKICSLFRLALTGMDCFHICLFNFQVFGDCPVNCLFSSFMVREDILYDFSSFLSLWPRIYSLLVTMVHSLEKNAYSAILGWILYKADSHGCWYFSVLHPCWFSSAVHYWVESFKSATEALSIWPFHCCQFLVLPVFLGSDVSCIRI